MQRSKIFPDFCLHSSFSKRFDGSPVPIDGECFTDCFGNSPWYYCTGKSLRVSLLRVMTDAFASTLLLPLDPLHSLSLCAVLFVLRLSVEAEFTEFLIPFKALSSLFAWESMVFWNPLSIASSTSCGNTRISISVWLSSVWSITSSLLAFALLFSVWVMCENVRTVKEMFSAMLFKLHSFCPEENSGKTIKKMTFSILILDFERRNSFRHCC